MSIRPHPPIHPITRALHNHRLNQLLRRKPPLRIPILPHLLFRQSTRRRPSHLSPAPSTTTASTTCSVENLPCVAPPSPLSSSSRTPAAASRISSKSIA